MAVYTQVSFDQAHAFFHTLGLGPLTRLQGCAGGIENTNYFADTAQARYVLTLFERLSAEQLPYYLHLMRHLAQHGIPVPDPAANAQGQLLHSLQGRPTSVVSLLAGKSELQPGTDHCAQVGAMLARMHLAGRSFDMQQPNLRGLDWWRRTVPEVLPFVTQEQNTLLQSELQTQEALAQSADYAALPRGPIHADLFRDNVMFAPDAQGRAQLTGFFDFYFAGNDAWVFDIAICLNDWCVNAADGVADTARTDAFMRAYTDVRRLEAAELAVFAGLLRAAALRFWLSRLWDLHLPREAAMLQAHDPAPFERILRQRIAHPLSWHAPL
ncbi:MAG: homoserine kinase [Rhodoferax sp.]|jgi:homoserine kinase type II|nr:homoserine kinase [Rhodoferax sp.]